MHVVDVVEEPAACIDHVQDRPHDLTHVGLAAVQGAVVDQNGIAALERVHSRRPVVYDLGAAGEAMGAFGCHVVVQHGADWERAVSALIWQALSARPGRGPDAGVWRAV